MTRQDPMRAELERIEAELAAQNRALDELCEHARAIGDVTFAVPRADVEAIAEASAEAPAIRPRREPTGIRC